MSIDNDKWQETQKFSQDRYSMADIVLFWLQTSMFLLLIGVVYMCFCIMMQ